MKNRKRPLRRKRKNKKPPRRADEIIADLQKITKDPNPRTTNDAATETGRLLEELEEARQKEPSSTARDAILGAAAAEIVRWLLQHLI
jgi:hypothetical protein